MPPLTENKPRAVGNLLVMIMFACLGLIGLMNQDFIGASIWLGLAAAFASFGPDDLRWGAISRPRRIIGLILLAISAALFGYQVGEDFVATPPSAYPASPDANPVQLRLMFPILGVPNHA